MEDLLDGSKKKLNELFVDIFNQILILEERTLTKGRFKDVSMTEIHVMEAIRKVNMPTMSFVAKKLMITVGTLTTSVGRLVEKGYVVRNRSETDRRVIYLDLTEKGEEIYAIHEKFHKNLIDAALDGVEDKGELKQALESIHGFFKHLQEGSL